MPPASATPEPIPIDSLAKSPADLVRVISQGKHWVVVEKPAGMLSVPGRGEDRADCVTARVAAMFPEATGPLTVHRLDMETSGLMVFALSRPAHAKLSRQFMHRKTGKGYVALLKGDVEDDQGRVELPLIVDWHNRPRQKVCHETGKPSLTLWRVTERLGHATRVEFRPETGRTHQLRLHAATPREAGGIGAPVLGDPLYGDPASAPRLMLHASFLAFWKPDSDEWLKFESQPPF